MTPEDPRHGTWAGYQAHLKDGEMTCRPCRDAANKRAREYEDREPVALTGGAWRFDPFRRVQIWVPSPTIAQRIACRRCGALPHESCTSKGGHRTPDHKQREIPRECHCGGQLEPRRQVCAGCREGRKVAA